MQVAERDEQLKKLSAISNQREQSSVKELEFKISQQEELIGSQEAGLSKLRSVLTELQRENQRFVRTDDKLQKLQDEYDATRSELERQSRKANTVEKYMQKVQSAQITEKERDRLKQELEDARRQLSSSSNLRLENLALQKTNSEVSRTLAQIEREYEEMRITNRQLRVQRDELARRNDDLEERAAQDDEGVAGLGGKHAENEISKSPTTDGVLENELSESSTTSRDMFVGIPFTQSNKLTDFCREQQILALQEDKQRHISEISDLRAASATSNTSTAAKETSPTDHSSQNQRLRQEIVALQDSLKEASAKYAELEGSLPVSQDKEDQQGTDGMSARREFVIRRTSGTNLLKGPIMAGKGSSTLDSLPRESGCPNSRSGPDARDARQPLPPSNRHESVTRQQLSNLLSRRSDTNNNAAILDIFMGKLDAARSQTIEEQKVS